MRTAERTRHGRLGRDVAAIAVAVSAVGVSFGAIAVASGVPGWAAVAMSVVVFAGGAQFMAVGLVAAGNPVAAILAGLLLNARHLPFGLAVADAVGPGRGARLLGSHLMVDESVAFALAQPDPGARRRAYWLTGGVLFVGWNLGCLAGVLLGGVAGDPAVLGLDAAFPAGLIALLLPSLRDRDTRAVALLGAAVAVLTTPLLPAGLPVLLALSGLVVLVLPARWRDALTGRAAGAPDGGAAGPPGGGAVGPPGGPAAGALRRRGSGAPGGADHDRAAGGASARRSGRTCSEDAECSSQ